MSQTAVMDVFIKALTTGAELAAPMLLTALVVGLAISILQSITQVQEQTVAFVPKLVAVAIALVVCGQWMISELVSFTQHLFADIPTLLSSAT
jgi:flagellar biosynthesis protein FliQ